MPSCHLELFRVSEFRVAAKHRNIETLEYWNWDLLLLTNSYIQNLAVFFQFKLVDTVTVCICNVIQLYKLANVFFMAKTMLTKEIIEEWM